MSNILSSFFKLLIEGHVIKKINRFTVALIPRYALWFTFNILIKGSDNYFRNKKVNKNKK